MSYYPEPSYSRNKIRVELGLSNYATKFDIKKATGVDTSNFAKKANLASLKSEVDKLDIDEVEAVLTGLNKLSNVVDNDVVKKNVYGDLVKKVNTIGSTIQ